MGLGLVDSYRLSHGLSLLGQLAYQFKLDWGAARSKAFCFVVIDEAFSRGSELSTRYALSLFTRLGLQLLIVTPCRRST